MRRHVASAEFASLFTSFTETAWRFESQPVYEVAEEHPALRRYLATGQVDTDYLHDWLDGVRRATRAGKRFERVRVLTEPLTDYLRFEMAVAVHNIEAGEAIRVLTAAERDQLDLPDWDFWLFDDSLVAQMEFEHHRPVGATLTDDAEMVRRCRMFRDTAWAHARPFLDDLATA